MISYISWLDFYVWKHRGKKETKSGKNLDISQNLMYQEPVTISRQPPWWMSRKYR